MKNLKMKKVKQLPLMLIVLGALLITGCGSSGGSAVNNDNDDAEDASKNQSPIANAGTAQDVSRNFSVNLTASDSSDADGDVLTYTWLQTSGPDVTDGVGSLMGEAPSFKAPESVGTIRFSLTVNDGQVDSAADEVTVNVLENVNVAYFVDGDNGSDSEGNGSRAKPFASIAKALCEITPDQQDIYIKTLASEQRYDETIDPCSGKPARAAEKILSIPTGTSLYGGYNANWERDKAANPTRVTTSYYGFRFTAIDTDAWFSGFNVQTQDAPGPDNDVYALYAVGGSATFYVNDNTLSAGNVGFGVSFSPGSSYGLLVALIETSMIERNTISAGFGGDADNADNLSGAAANGGPGVSSSSKAGANAGDGKGSEDYDGGKGGNGGTGVYSDGASGGNGQKASGASGSGGGSGGSGNTAANGKGGTKGAPGAAGAGGAGGNGNGSISASSIDGFFVQFTLGKGSIGNTGGAGAGGGGGGGGEATLSTVNGSGGGGGGGGGAGGTGGTGAAGGGASIALFIAAVNTSIINENTIASGAGGAGATGGLGQTGGVGGIGGTGAKGQCGVFGCGDQGGDGGNGGNGGKGGAGGRGGAGGGGPSYAIAIGDMTAPSISNNTITSGDGGWGGYGGNNGNGGTGGYSYAVFYDRSIDSVIPALSNNTLSAGQPGNGGGTTGDVGSTGSVGQSGLTNW
jgi:K319-like protein